MDYYYVLSARNSKNKKFIAEPGEAKYLKVPWGQVPSPAHQIDPAKWVLGIRDLADGKADERVDEAGDVLFFVHGYNNDLKSVTDRTCWLQEDLTAAKWDGVVVAFDWPSENSTLNYLEDRSDAASTALEMVRSGICLLAEGRKKGCETNIHLLGHSTGAYVITKAFELAKDDGDLNNKLWSVAQVALIAGDISARGWEDGPLFERIARLTNYQNGYDYVLGVSNAKRFGTSPRAGRVGLPANANAKAVNVDCSEFFASLDPNDQPKKTGTWCHSWQIGNPTWTLDLAMTLEGRIDRNYLPTRRIGPHGLTLQPGSRPAFENEWLEHS